MRTGHDSGIHILCAEDDPATRRLIRLCLEEVGFRVSPATDGQSAWDILRTLEVDALVTDHQMPGMTGLELAGRIRRAGMELPILFVSGSIASLAEVEDMNLDHTAVLAKPFTPEHLIEAVRQILHRFGAAPSRETGT